MASVTARKNKAGEIISYQIKVTRGRDKLTGKQLTLKCTPCQGHFNSEGWKNLRPHDMILLYHPRRIVQR